MYPRQKNVKVMFYEFKEFSILKTKFLYYPEYMLGKQLNTCNLLVVFSFFVDSKWIYAL